MNLKQLAADYAARHQTSQGLSALNNHVVDQVGIDALPIHRTSGRFRLFSTDDVLSEPSPEWRVDGLLPVGAMSMIYAPQESFKTFFGLDIALSVAIGADFHGRAVKQGPTVYVLGEGRGGLKNRICAWLRHHDVSRVAQAFFVLEAVQFKNPGDVDTLKRQIESRNIRPAMVFIDTFARNAVGVDENDAMEIGVWINAVTELKQAMNVDVVALHHSQKQKSSSDKVRERGSSAFIGAVDTVIRLQRKKKTTETITVSCEKQKDAEHFAPFTLDVEVIKLGKNEHGDDSSSCVLVKSPDWDGQKRLSRQCLNLLNVLIQFEQGTADRKDWMPKTGLEERTFDRYREELLRSGYIAKTETRGAYRLTDEGFVAIDNEWSSSSQEEPSQVVAATPHPL